VNGPLVLDTGGWLLALAGEAEYASALEAASILYVPSLVLAEVDYHLRRRRAEMQRLVADLVQGAYLLEPITVEDLLRADEIGRKFASLELGLVDATVAAVAERLEVRRILTTDSDFVAVRIGRRWDQALELVVHPPGRSRGRS
jgi:predicted nucleic acid-binding protein